MNYIIPEDVCNRIYFKKRNWYRKPIVNIEGDEGKFGKIKIDFGDEVVDFSIYLKNKKQIKAVVEMAFENFHKFDIETGNFYDFSQLG